MTAPKLPIGMKIRRGEGKYVLKKLAEKYLPHEIIYRRKVGFALPAWKWTAGCVSLLEDSVLAEALMVRPETLTGLAQTGTYMRWTLINCELWARLFLAGRRPETVQLEMERAL